jgi:hypothetical protein
VAEPSVRVFDVPGPTTVRVEIPAGVLAVVTWHEPRVEVEVSAARGDERSTAAAREGVSANAWIVRALARALEPRGARRSSNRLQGFARS